MLKLKQLQDVAGSFGVQLGRMSSVPHGVNKFADIAALAPDAQVIFDVGANTGQTAEEARRYFPAARILSFEPVPATFAGLQANTASDPKIEAVQLALGDMDGTAKMTAMETSGQNTLNMSAKPGAPTVDIQVRTLDAFCAERGISEIGVLKIDTEGYEMPVLRGAKRMLENGAIKMILAECEFTHNPDEPHGDFFAIAGLLIPLGYRVVSFYTGGVDGGGWRWGDVLFMLPNGQRPVSCSPFA